MKSPFDETLTLIDDAIKSARSDDHYAVDGDGAFEFMKGYIRALTDYSVITHEESQILRKELNKIPTRAGGDDASSGWRGFILRLIGVSLPDKHRVFIKGVDAKDESIYPNQIDRDGHD